MKTKNDKLADKVIEICKKPHEEEYIYEHLGKEFSNITRKRLHFLLLRLTYHGIINETLNWEKKEGRAVCFQKTRT